MIRFNEAIDQMLLESVREHTQRTGHTRDILAGVLGHSVHSPVVAILNSANVLLRDASLSSTGVRTCANVQRNTMRMKRTIYDLFIFTSIRRGSTTRSQLSFYLAVACSGRHRSRRHTATRALAEASFPNASGLPGSACIRLATRCQSLRSVLLNALQCIHAKFDCQR